MVAPTSPGTTQSRRSSNLAAKRGGMLSMASRRSSSVTNLLRGMPLDEIVLNDEDDMEEYISRELTLEEIEEDCNQDFDKLGSNKNSEASEKRSSNGSRLDEREILLLERRNSHSGRFRLGKQDLDELQNLRVDESVKKHKLVANLREGRSVHFDHIEIREYPILLGANPGGSRGPPLTIEWNSFRTTKIRVDEYEESRASHRRHLGELRTTPKYRVDLLKRLGVTVLDMYTAARDAERVRVNRHWTHAHLGRMEFAERMETSRRAVRNILSLGRIQRRERQYLEMYVPSYNANCGKTLPKQVLAAH
jgi:hypothetical protein